SAPNAWPRIKLAKPQPFDGTRGAAAEAFVAQIALHVITYPEQFPTNASKVAFATSFMRDYAATWCQPYLNRIFSSEPLDWTDLMSFYQNRLKENIQLAVVMSNIQFNFLRSMQAMALKVSQTIKGIQIAHPAPNTSTSISAPNPKAMDLSTFQRGPSNQLSDTERGRWVQGNLCFRCGQEGHISRGCLNGGRKPQVCPQPPPSTRISELQVEINCLCASHPAPSSPTPPSENSGSSKNGGAQV
ncbi:uncharacterized protein VP01_6405g1, partial [Puccinia sorghi]